jgi:hypothetical protein
VQRAEAAGVIVHELDPARPFSAARARNEGFDVLRTRHPEVAVVQFLDGDCEVADGWFDAALSVLSEQSDVLAVHGRLHEIEPDASPYNRLYEMEWAAPQPGEESSFGGNFMVRADAFARAGGFDPAVIAAEDDELAVRLRRVGGRILRLADPMAYHDAAMYRFSQWWRRSTRLGHAYAQVADLHGNAPERYFVGERRRALLWGLGIPVSILVLLLPSGGLSLALLVVYPLQLVRLALGARRRGMSTRDALLWSTACVVSRFAEVVGMARYHLNKLRRRTTEIIEYKDAPHVS